MLDRHTAGPASGRRCGDEAAERLSENVGVEQISHGQSEARMRVGAALQSLITIGLVIVVAGAAPGDRSPLIDAARNADIDALRALVEAGVDVGAREGDGTTALHWTSHWDDVEGIELLIRAGADVNAANDLGATPLWAAAMNGSAAAVERLLGAGATPNKGLRHGETPLMTASRAGDASVVEMLLLHAADPNAVGVRDQTALMWAAAQGHSEVVAVLLEHGADVHARSEVWTNYMAAGNATHPEHSDWFEHGGNTALMFAARRGDLASARHLVAAGADVNHTNGWGLTPLAWAVQANAPPLHIVGADRHDSRRLELIRLAGQEYFPQQFDDPGIVDFLLEEGADPNLGADQFTPLHAAIMHRDERMVGRLLEYGADPNLPLGSWTPDRRGSHIDFNFDRAWVGARPFWLAARFGTPDMLRRLVDHGADPLIAHRGERWTGGGIFADHSEEITTPLMAALGLSRSGGAWHPPHREGHEREAEALEKTRLMVELGLDVNAVDGDGRTPLDGALVLEYDSVAEFLIEAGAKQGNELRE